MSWVLGFVVLVCGQQEQLNAVCTHPWQHITAGSHMHVEVYQAFRNRA